MAFEPPTLVSSENEIIYYSRKLKSNLFKPIPIKHYVKIADKICTEPNSFQTGTKQPANPTKLLGTIILTR
jgi:hypothetical protein